MANTDVYSEWAWTCDDCGEGATGLDTREDAHEAAANHECEQ